MGTDTIVNGFVMIAEEESESTFIYLGEKMNRDDLESLTAEKMNDGN